VTSPTGSTRPLQYPLNTNADIESQTPPDAVAFVDLSTWSTSDPDIRVSVIMNLSLNEYVAIANVVDVGRDIAYGDNSIYIWWLWSRMLTSMTICEDVANCIETTPSLQSLIQSTVNGNPETGGQQDRVDTLAFDVEGCDEDTIYGYCVALWQYINGNTIDALQKVAEATNASEQLSKILTTVIPGMELLPVDEVLGWIESFGNYNLEAYEASITIGLEQQIICDLFCLALDNDCHLDFGQVYQYFIDEMGGVDVPTALATFGEWVYFMVVGSYPTDRIVYLWSAFQLALAFMGQKFLGLSTVTRYALVAQAGDPDDDWMTLCDECVNTWSMSWLLDNGNPTGDGWTIDQGTYSDTPDKITGVSLSDAKYIQLTYTFDETVVITGVTYTVDIKSPTNGNNVIYIRNASNTNIQNVTVGVVEASVTQRTISWSGSQEVQSGWYLRLASNARVLAQSPSTVMTTLTVTGTGVNPFV